MRYGMPAIVGELLTGVLLGPSLFVHVFPGVAGWLLPTNPEQAHLMDALGQLGILLLVGITGAQMDLGMVRRRGATVVRVSLSGLLVPLALGVATGYLLPASLIPAGSNRGTFAMFLGVAMCVTAIPVIAKTLADMNMLHRNVAQLTLAAGTVDDVVGWFLLSIVAGMATVGVSVGLVSISVLSLVGFIVVAVVVGRPLTRLALRIADRSAEAGPTVATTVIIVLLGAAATHALKMESFFGAFVIGMVIGSTRVADPAKLAPLRTFVLAILVPLFLASAGLRMDLTALADPRVLLAAVVVLAVAIVGKFAGAYLGARLSRLSHWEGLALGAGMNARGVVEVIIAMVGLQLGVLSTATYTIVIVVAIATSLMAPPLLRWAMSHIEQNEEERLRQATHAAWSVPASLPVRDEDH